LYSENTHRVLINLQLQRNSEEKRNLIANPKNIAPIINPKRKYG